MDQEFFKQQALRVRDLAEKAEPFTRKRLLDLAGKYYAKMDGPSRIPLLREWPVSIRGQSGEI